MRNTGFATFPSQPTLSYACYCGNEAEQWACWCFLVKGMRGGEIPAGGRGQFPQNSSDPPPRLIKSRTSLELNNNGIRAANKVAQQGAASTTVTSITIQKQLVNEVTASPAGQFVLQRSKSSGSHLSLQQQKVIVPTATSTTATPKVDNSELPDVSSFPETAQILLRKIAVGRLFKFWNNKFVSI